mmetsp:Transcript_814/g.1045  ORF Transcript_814/g.1045 Transcript_814/m.1045 type:complete len:84 (-) Transcript_814:17-268(-)
MTLSNVFHKKLISEGACQTSTRDMYAYHSYCQFFFALHIFDDDDSILCSAAALAMYVSRIFLLFEEKTLHFMHDAISSFFTSS